MFTKKGIKIIHAEWNSLFSAFANGKSVTYKVGAWINRPKNCGPLAVFKNLKNAKRFMERNDRHFLNRYFYKCKYKKSKDKYLWNDEGEQLHMVPKGTRFADKVLLIKQC